METVKILAIGSKAFIGDKECTICELAYPKMEYLVSYWNNGERNTAWVLESELTGKLEKTTIGFSL